jgi:KDO2-lipid IV(A) lauroyltransferase
VAPVFCRSAEVVFRPLDNALLDTYVQKLRSRFGTRLHGRGSGARTRLDDALATGSNIIVLPDVNWQERGGTFVDFFGRPASTATSVAELAIRHEAAIVPAFVLWNEENRRYSFIFGSTLKTPVNGAEGPQNLTQAATSAIESVIRKNPEQWHWYHRRWKTRPPGEPPIY